MSSIRRLFPVLLLLTVGPCAVHGQIVVSGGRGSIVVSGSGPARSQEPEPKPVQLLVEKPVVKPVEPVKQFRTEVRQERYLVSEPWCGYCPAAKARFLASGGKPENIVSMAGAAALGFQFSSVPHEFTIQRVVESRVETHQSPSRNTADQPSNYSESQRQNDINHLLTHRSHAGKFSREYLESLSGYQLIDLHNGDHGVTTSKGVKTTNTVVQSATVANRVAPPVRYIQAEVPGRYVVYDDTTYDMETWSRMCSLRNCGMCQYLDSMQSQYRANKAAMNNPQSSSSPDVVDEAIAIMNLTPDDVVAELGCGDGKAAIQMVKRSGCRVDGYEIDPQKVAEARQNVIAAGLSDRITIHEKDVVGLNLPDSTTAIYAFLYPELLAKIKPQLMTGRVAVCPGHSVDGIGMQLIGQCWVRKSI